MGEMAMYPSSPSNVYNIATKLSVYNSYFIPRMDILKLFAHGEFHHLICRFSRTMAGIERQTVRKRTSRTALRILDKIYYPHFGTHPSRISMTAYAITGIILYCKKYAGK